MIFVTNLEMLNSVKLSFFRHPVENHYFPHDTVDLGSFNKGGKLSLEIKRR